MDIKHRETAHTLTTLANASDLVANIGQAVIGNDVADTFNGSELTRATIHQLAQTEFQATISKYLGV